MAVRRTIPVVFNIGQKNGLFYFRKFGCLLFESGTHHIRILEKTQTQEERYYYMHRCVMENLSVDGLVKIIKQDDFLHKSILPNNFVNTISDPATARKAVMMFKDEYFLDFINTEKLL